MANIIELIKKSDIFHRIVMWSVAIWVGCNFMSCKSTSVLETQEVKYSKEDLVEDFLLFRKNLEKVHPGLYWYTSKEEMDASFDDGLAAIRDSMTEAQFRLILMRINAKVRCGHTAIQRPKKKGKTNEATPKLANFPYDVKYWSDTMVVLQNRDQSDSTLKEGTIIQSINGVSPKALVEEMFEYMSSDGYNTSYKALSLGYEGNFDNLYSFIYGIPDTFTVGYIDSNQLTKYHSFIPPSKRVVKDSLAKPREEAKKIPKVSKKKLKQARLQYLRHLTIDTAQHTAFMSLQTFSVGFGIRKFVRRSFKQMESMGIQHLILDVRGNGGGQPSLSTHLSRYLSKKPFVIADSLYAVNRKIYTPNVFLRASHHIKMLLSTPFQTGDKYHLKWYERKMHRPKKKAFFDGNVYVLAGPASFSATIIFLNTIRGQDNVVIAGEETGGGSYGNSAFIIPILTLPHSKTRLRLPVFRFVDDVNIPKDGHGIRPDVLLGPNYDVVKKRKDYKMEWVKDQIRLKNQLDKPAGDNLLPTRKVNLSN